MTVYKKFFTDDGEPAVALTVTCKTYEIDGGGSAAQTVDTVNSEAVTSAVQIDVVAAARTFTRASGSFITDGHEVGDGVEWGAFTNAGNNRKCLIETVTALVITVTSATSGGLVDETGSGNETAQGLIPGLYSFVATFAQLVSAHWNAGVDLIGADRYVTEPYGPSEPATNPDVIYTTWYTPRFQYVDTPGLAGSARPLAEIEMIGNATFYTGSGWQGSTTTVEMVERSGDSGVYETTIAFADIDRFNGHDGYRIKITGDQGIRYLMVYPMDAGYDVWASEHRGATAIPTTFSLWNSIRVLFQRVQWATGATGETVLCTIRRVNDAKFYDDSTNSWKTSPVANITLTAVDATNRPGLYEFVIPPADLDAALGRDGYDVRIEDSELQVIHDVRIMPLSSAAEVWGATATDYSTAGSMGLLARLAVGLAFNNYRLSSPIYDGNGNMLTGTIKVYPTAADAAANTSPLQSFSVTCTYSGNQLSTYLVEGTS